MAVRTRRLFGPIQIATAGAWVPLYTVPSGRTLKVTSIMAATYANGTTFAFGITAAGSGGPEVAYASAIGDHFAIAFGSGWAVNPGEVMSVYVENSNRLKIYGSGSLLLGAPA